MQKIVLCKGDRCEDMLACTSSETHQPYMTFTRIIMKRLCWHKDIKNHHICIILQVLLGKKRHKKLIQQTLMGDAWIVNGNSGCRTIWNIIWRRKPPSFKILYLFIDKFTADMSNTVFLNGFDERDKFLEPKKRINVTSDFENVYILNCFEYR